MNQKLMLRKRMMLNRFVVVLTFSAFLSVASTALGARDVEAEAEIEFRSLLIIKKRTEAWSPLFLPVRGEMTELEISSARRCFEIETPKMVDEISRGRVRFIPTVHVSEQPLRYWRSDRLDSAEILSAEMLNEFAELASPGEFDSVGYYFLPWDHDGGYSIPRAGYGAGWFEADFCLGAFAVHSTNMDPRDEIFLHEWLHGLERFYHGREGVRLPRGWLHGGAGYGYIEGAYRPGDTFLGWMKWYQDFLNGEIKEVNGYSGLGPSAWVHGPMRSKQPERFPHRAIPVDSQGSYPEWVLDLMDGNLASAKLGVDILRESERADGGISPWSHWSWRVHDGDAVRRVGEDGDAVIGIRSKVGGHIRLSRRVAVEPLKNYVLSAEVFVEGVETIEAGGSHAVRFQAGGNSAQQLPTGTGGWSPVSVCFTTGKDAGEVELILGLGGVSSVTKGEVIFRNVRLRKVLYPSRED